jgi:hypothetical protein
MVCVGSPGTVVKKDGMGRSLSMRLVVNHVSGLPDRRPRLSCDITLSLPRFVLHAANDQR